MKLAFSNNSTKVWLARKGPTKVFGKDVDKREGLSDADAIKWFDQVWEGTLRAAVEQAKQCNLSRFRFAPWRQSAVSQPQTECWA